MGATRGSVHGEDRQKCASYHCISGDLDAPDRTACSARVHSLAQFPKSLLMTSYGIGCQTFRMQKRFPRHVQISEHARSSLTRVPSQRLISSTL